jgi:hypothetical protein
MEDMSESGKWNDSVEVDYTPYIVAPSSTDQEATYYTTHVEPALLAALEPLDVEFFFTLTILHVPTVDDGVLVSPLIVVFTTNEHNFNIIRSKVESLWVRTDFQRYLVSISLGYYSASASNDIPHGQDATRTYHSHWKCGISIGWKDATATSGPILENKAGEYSAITCAHLFEHQENDCVSLKVTQPSFEDYRDLYKASVDYRTTCDYAHSKALDERSRIEWESRFNNSDNFVRRLDAVRHDTSEHYQMDAETASVIKSSYTVVDFCGRRCLQDYALLRLHSRLPDSIDRICDPLPPRGYLAELNWAKEPITVGSLRYDIQVKKRGASTGVTYGVIAGVYGVLKAGGAAAARKEFWALLSTSLYQFGDRGDSGSLVWTKDGEAVGIIIAGWTVMFDKPAVRAAILPNRYWDTKNIPFFRDEEGNIDFKELMSFVVSRPLCLIESLEMVLHDIGGDYQLWVP